MDYYWFNTIFNHSLFFLKTKVIVHLEMAKMSIMMFLLMFVAYSFASNCSPHTNCGDCVSHMGGHNCVWCTLSLPCYEGHLRDMQCHDVGSPGVTCHAYPFEDPCSNGLCISK